VETLYDRLGVPRDVDEAGLRRAWKRIVRTVHPDAGGDTESFQELQRAYEVLSHANKRAFYDLALDTYLPGASSQPVPIVTQGPPPEWTTDPGSLTVLPAARRPRWRRTGRHEGR
jgi:curved DNA-binding protein CbpA